MAVSEENKDHVLAAVKAAINVVPLVGGPIASLIDDYVPSWKERNLDAARKALASKLNDLEAKQQRLDKNAVKNDEFAELFCRWERVVRETRREEKISAANNLLSNALLMQNDPARSSAEELHFLMHCVDTLSIGAIHMLGAVRGNRWPPNYHNTSAFPVIRQKFSNLDQDMALALLSELRSFNLVQVTEGVISTSDYSHISVKLTPLGERLATRFVEGLSDGSPT